MAAKLKVKEAFLKSTVHFRSGNKMVKIRRLGEATQDQLEKLSKIGHPGVIKETAAAGSKAKGKAGSSS